MRGKLKVDCGEHAQRTNLRAEPAPGTEAESRRAASDRQQVVSDDDEDLNWT